MKVSIAIEGCCHGELDRTYQLIRALPKDEKPELLLITGDFQSVRNHNDLKCVSMPAKYRKLGDFQDYYTSKKKAPVLTIFIGGNHEASNYLQELKFGGWVAPNIYYLGKSNVIWYKGLKIAGVTGIFNDYNFMKPSFEKVPYDQSSIRSVYHVRKLELLKFLFYERINQHKIDIFLSHDWPQHITNFGDLPTLLKAKPFFQKDIQIII